MCNVAIHREVVQDEVLLCRGNESASGHTAGHDNSAETEEVFNIIHAENGLHGDVRRCEVVRNVKGIDKVYRLGGVVLKLDLELSPCCCKSCLQTYTSGRSAAGNSAVEESEQIGADASLYILEQGCIGLTDGSLIAGLLDRLGADCLSPLLEGNVADCRLGGGVLRQGDNLAFCDCAALERAGSRVDIHGSAFHHRDFAGYTQHLHELVKAVVGELRNKVYFTHSCHLRFADEISLSGVSYIGCCHLLFFLS